ncbi:electron transfer flavoprotein subunit beta/FixA family protein [Myroides sp. LJL116]
MKILVCISHVPDTTSKINFVNGDTEFDTTGVQFVINPNDEYALTKAIKLKEAHGASVTVVNVGDASTEPTIRKALAIGADQGIRINEKPIDSFSVANAIAKVAKEGEYDLILCGKESLDYNGGMVPGMVAALLGYEFINSCEGLQIQDQSVTAIRQIDGGTETISAKLPLVIGGQKGLVEEKDLIIPNMRGIMTARSKALNVVEATADELATQTVKFDKPAPKGACKMISPDNVQELIDLLHNEAKVI